ncbi:Nucleolar complex protein 2 like [Schistosoma japonicum]|nr:Nucleolar complex protein 2 like [Schistosoma japonicum]
MLKSLLQDPVLDLKRINNKIPKLIRHEKLEKKFFKLMVKTWSEDEDSRRLLAFLNIMKALSVKKECTGLCIKLMFVAFVRNCKFVLGSNIAQINLMHECLLEMFSKNLDEAYMHAFVYTRQLAITLRKAYSSKTKEDMQSVSNWQFVYSLRLWCDFASRYGNDHALIQSLIHPLSQLVYGTIKLNKGQRWLPLRFHCISMLHNMAGVPVLCELKPSEDKQMSADDDNKLPLVGRALSTNTRLLIPTLPLLLDVFQLVNFNQRSGRVSNAPLDLRLLLHFTPSQLHETASKDAIISWLFDLLAECMALHANSIIKQFLRVCRVASFCRQMKALLIKVREHSEWIVKCRRRIRNLANKNEIVSNTINYFYVLFLFKSYQQYIYPVVKNLHTSVPGLTIRNEMIGLNIESTCTLLDNSNKLLPFWQFYVQHKKIRSTELNRLTESNKKEPIPSTEYDSNKLKTDSGDSDSESEHSDSSYDIDDGKTVTHISKSKGKQKSKKAKTKDKQDNYAGTNDEKSNKHTSNADDESDESDFDLEAALMDEDDNKSVNNCDLDQLDDFELEGVSSDDYSDTDNLLDEKVSSEGSDIEMTDLSKPTISKSQRKTKTTAVKKTSSHVVPKKPIPKVKITTKSKGTKSDGVKVVKKSKKKNKAKKVIPAN